MKAGEGSGLFGWTQLRREGVAASGLAATLSATAGLLLPLCALLGSSLRRLAIAGIAVSLALAPLPAPLAGGGPEHAGSASLAAQAHDGHGHSHDGGEAADHSTAHTHGHDPADHSHQYAFLSGGGSRWDLPPPQRWPEGLSEQPDAARGFVIERPPKRAQPL